MSFGEQACDVCGGSVKKMVSTSSFSLKGDGWYRDHYGLKPAPTGTSTAPAPTPAKGPSQGVREAIKSS